MSISAIRPHGVMPQPKAGEAAEAKGAPDHDGDSDDQAAAITAAAAASSPSGSGSLQPGFSLLA